MTQGERIKELRKALNLTLERFGEKVGVTKQTVSRIENGINNVTDQMFKSICREFNVNEEWLQTGEGDMFIEMSEQEEIAAFVGKILRKDMDGNIRQKLIHVLSQLGEEEWLVIEKIARQIAKEYSNEKKD